MSGGGRDLGPPLRGLGVAAPSAMSTTQEPTPGHASVSPPAFAEAQLHQRAAVLKSFGGPEGFALTALPLPIPGDQEVRVRVRAASVQFTDTLLRKGRYPLRQRPPLVLGYDVVGEIDALGPLVNGLKIGDRVADLTTTGSYARYRTLRADRVVRVPAGVGAAEAVSLVLSWVTAQQLLHREGRVVPGQHVLVLGAAGAVGQALLALGQLAGLKMWGSIARPDQAQLIRSLGATPLGPQPSSWRVAAPEGFDLVLDGIGEHGFTDAWSLVKAGGKLVAFGFAGRTARQASLLEMGWWLLRIKLWNAWPNGKSARFYSITSLRQRHPEWFRNDLARLFELLRQGRIHPLVQERIGLEGIADAHRRIEGGGLQGKIVLCPWNQGPDFATPRTSGVPSSYAQFAPRML